MQHGFALDPRNHLLWGAGLRCIDERITNTPSFGLVTPERDAEAVFHDRQIILHEDVVDAAARFDARLAWRPTKQLELSLVGQTLLDKARFEFGQQPLTVPTEAPRSVYAKLSWTP